MGNAMEDSMEDHVRDLFDLVRRTHQNKSWRDINPMYAATLRLAITSRMKFNVKPEEFGSLVRRFGAHHWIGESWEPWYALAVECGHPTAVLAIENYLGRKPAWLKGERITVGKSVQWNGQPCRCTSIDDRSGVVRLKRDEIDWKGGPTGDGQDGAGGYVRFPGTLYTISIQKLEELRAEELATEKALAKQQRDSKIADPVALLPFGRHLDEEIRKHAKGTYRGLGVYLEDDYHLKQQLTSTSTDYREYWDACTSGYSLAAYLQWVGCTKTQVDGSAEEIRRKYPWKKVEQAIFRFVRECRGLPLRDGAV